MSDIFYRKSNFETEVWPKEQERIRQRRKLAGLPLGEPDKDSFGLALSGGGIRSATFNLGVLQALQRYEILQKVDLLSTVSGGGYIGSCLTWFMSKSAAPEFPFGTKRADHDGLGGKVLAWLRAHGSYLTPGEGLNYWALGAAFLTGVIINLLILLPFFLLSIYLLSLNFPDIANFDSVFWSLTNAWGVLRGLGAVFIGIFLLTVLITAVAYGRARNFDRHRKTRVWKGRLLMLGVLGVCVGVLPLLYELIANSLQSVKLASSTISLGGIFSFALGFFKRNQNNEITGMRSLLLTLGLTLLSLGIILLLYHFVASINLAWYYYVGGFGFAVLLAALANVNHVSMHRFYRNCLMEAYLPSNFASKINKETHKIEPTVWKDSDLCMMHEIPQTAAPYQIINTMMNTMGSEESKLKGRGGENFIFSPLYCGAESTGYAPTNTYEGGTANLATALAISGAAVNPNTFATRSRPIIFLMTLLNIRLGYWIGNPKFYSARASRIKLWFLYLFTEMFVKGLDETHKQLHLSDGGHFENLGLYELLRRKCKLIIVSDAGADPQRGFGDLAKLLEMARMDFGVKIEGFDVSELRVEAATGCSKSAFAFGTIYYADDSLGKLVYLKPSLIPGLPEDVYSYGKENSLFPHQSTGDQFFDELQFEAYRELGYQLSRKLVHSEEWGKTK